MIPDTNEHSVKRLPELKVGDRVVRYLAGTIRMPLTVVSVSPILIKCSGDEYPGADWEFDPIWGCEIDDDLGWGPPPKMTGSFIVKEDS